MTTELLKQYILVDSGKTVLVEAEMLAGGLIEYSVDSPDGVTEEEYTQAIERAVPAAEKALKSKLIFG